MALFKNVSNSTVVIAKHSIFPEAIFSDEKYTAKEKESVKKFIRLGYFISAKEEKSVEEIKPVEEAIPEPLVEDASPKKKPHKVRG